MDICTERETVTDSSNSDESTCGASEVSSKKAKYAQGSDISTLSLQGAVEKKIGWLSSSKGSEYGFCVPCIKHLSCSKGGIRDLQQHGDTWAHKKRVEAGSRQHSLLSMLNASESMSRKAAEAEA